MITKKTMLAIESGCGIMIWEVGQDCRLETVNRKGKQHTVTCPNGESDSLLYAVRMALLVGNGTTEESAMKLMRDSEQKLEL